MAGVLASRLIWLREEALMSEQNKLARIIVGGIITSIFLELRISVTAQSTHPQFFDETALSNSWFLGGMVDNKYVYRFHRDESHTQKILLPQRDLTDMSRRKNVIFLPPRSSLYTLAKDPIPTPFWKVNKDKAEAASERTGKERAEPSTAADESIYGAERYRFTPYSEPVASHPGQVAHKHIGLLQSLCYYQKKSIEKMGKVR